MITQISKGKRQFLSNTLTLKEELGMKRLPIFDLINIGIIKLQNDIIVYADENVNEILCAEKSILGEKFDDIFKNFQLSHKSRDFEIINSNIKEESVCLTRILIDKPSNKSVLIVVKPKDGIDYKLSNVLSRDNLLRQLNFLIESVHDDMCITNGEGTIVRVSGSWEKKHGVKAAEVVGKHVSELEKQGIFAPSVTMVVLKEKRRIEMLQYNKKGEKILVTGVPLFNEYGEIEWIISYSSWDVTNFEILKEKYENLEKLMERYSAEIKELRNRDMKLPGVICESSQMNSIIDIIKKTSTVDINLLITGETGVGKNLIAKLVHQISSRKDEAFIEINCGAIPENLIESELFGYEKGAFTGARKEGKVGLIELAHKGTLFLDEIGELPLNLQVKLLKVIQDKVISRVGGTKPIPVDFRLIAATNRDLLKLVEEGKFRLDLYYRISVVPINIPPLRDRKDDLKALIEYLLSKANKKYNKKKILSDTAMEVLMSYQWPGNVRELENIVDQIVITSDEEYISSYHIPDNLSLMPKLKGENCLSLKEAMEFYESKLITHAYKKYKTTVGVSKALGISQATAVRKIQKYIHEIQE